MTKPHVTQFQVPDHWPLSRRMAHFRKPPDGNGCITWSGLVEHGYAILNWKGKKKRAHRISWELANGPIPTGLMVCHRCDVRACVNVDHLFIDTHNANMADMVAKDRQAKGEAQGHALLTAEQVHAIRADTRPAIHIAQQYGVSREAIRDIKLRKNWRHI